MTATAPSALPAAARGSRRARRAGRAPGAGRGHQPGGAGRHRGLHAGARPAGGLQRPLRPRLRRPARRARDGHRHPVGRAGRGQAGRGDRHGRAVRRDHGERDHRRRGPSRRRPGRDVHDPADPGRPRLAGRPGRRPDAHHGPLGLRTGGDRARARPERPPAGARHEGHGERGARLAAAHRGRPRLLGHRDRRRLGAARGAGEPASPARFRGGPDALPVRPRRDDRRGERRHRADPRRAAARLAARRAVLSDRQVAGDLLDRAVGAVHRGVRPDRPGDVGADRGQRGQRGRGGGHPADRRAQVHRVLARSGGGGLPDPGGGARAGRLPAGRGRRQPAVDTAARPDRRGVRRGRAGRAVLGRPGRAAGHAGAGRPGGAAARGARGPAERGAGHRDRPGAAPVRRVRGAPAARPGPPAAPAGHPGPGRPVHPARPAPWSRWPRSGSAWSR